MPDSADMPKIVLHKASSRGYANHGWLQSYHTFSFANYHNPERIHFGALRVLNDDTIEGGMGFGTHPHDNMEIVSIPLSGELRHKDSMGNVTVIRQGEVQVMSAGTGIFHSEYNNDDTDLCKFLQIWVFPNKKNVTPRYGQMYLEGEGRRNKFQQILSPNADDDGVWIYQNAWFHLTDMDKEFWQEYKLKKAGNGVYLFVLEGDVSIAGNALQTRDGIGIWDTQEIGIMSHSPAKLLLMEVPMRL